MSKYTVAIEVTYDFKGELLQDYLEWLDDYKDTESMRQCFILDRFAPLTWYSRKELAKSLRESDIGKVIDPKAKLTIKKENK